MFIPQGDWCVVIRHVRDDNNSRGQIVKGGLTEAKARDIAQQMSENPLLVEDYNVWALPRSEY